MRGMYGLGPLYPAPRTRRVRVVRCRAGHVEVTEGECPVRLALRAQDREALIAAAEAHPNGAWVHVATVGLYRGHASGEFEFTPALFDQMIANERRRITPIPWKYEHPSGDGPPVPTAGRVAALERRGNKLYALSVFTDRAAQMIRDDEYSYCSVVAVLDAQDGVSGEDIGAELVEIGLTDSPFIDGLEPITLRSAA